MADGASTLSRRRMRYATDADDAARRFEADASPRAKKPGPGGHDEEDRPRPRIAYTGEEFGFGFRAAESFVERGRRRTIFDGGFAVARASTPQELRAYSKRLEAGENARFDFNREVWQPLRTKEQALAAVKQHTADFAIVPFYHPYSGYDFETLRTLGALGSLLAVEQVEASDQLCLAVHESQLYDIIQSSHPGTGFSALQRRLRQSWGVIDAGSGNMPDPARPVAHRAGLPVDMADQKLIRDRIDMVFAGPEAARRCKSKLDGLRAIGVAVQEIPEMVEPHRELAKRARSTAYSARLTNTIYDPVTGETRFSSALGADAQAGKLFGMVLPFQVAMMSSDYVVVDHDFDDGPVEKTRFFVVDYIPDHTLVEDAYRTTDARTRYWYRRLSAVARASSSIPTFLLRAVGGLGMAFGLTALFFGVVGATNLEAAFLTDELSKWLTPAEARTAALVGAAAMGIAWFFLQAQAGARQGVRVMFRFRRNDTAASIGDVENFLRNHGVRHAVVRTDEDSEGHEPAPIVLDVEFEPEDFGFNPLTVFSGRRLQNSVVNGALKKAFARWKNRGVTVIAAAPIEQTREATFAKPAEYAFQLPKPKARRWWSEAVSSWVADFAETMFIRVSRVLVYLLPLAFLAYVIWAWMTGRLG